ncbi:hypothetical protein T06_4559 [Trichinella sp. T6]|nr:hypothetical protein T06_4559 [Trichinella sp. T6]
MWRNMYLITFTNQDPFLFQLSNSPDWSEDSRKLYKKRQEKQAVTFRDQFCQSQRWIFEKVKLSCSLRRPIECDLVTAGGPMKFAHDDNE